MLITCISLNSGLFPPSNFLIYRRSYCRIMRSVVPEHSLTTSLLHRERFLAKDRDVFVLKPHPYGTSSLVRSFSVLYSSTVKVDQIHLSCFLVVLALRRQFDINVSSSSACSPWQHMAAVYLQSWILWTPQGVLCPAAYISSLTLHSGSGMTVSEWVVS